MTSAIVVWPMQSRYDLCKSLKTFYVVCTCSLFQPTLPRLYHRFYHWLYIYLLGSTTTSRVIPQPSRLYQGYTTTSKLPPQASNTTSKVIPRPPRFNPRFNYQGYTTTFKVIPLSFKLPQDYTTTCKVIPQPPRYNPRFNYQGYTTTFKFLPRLYQVSTKFLPRFYHYHQATSNVLPNVLRLPPMFYHYLQNYNTGTKVQPPRINHYQRTTCELPGEYQGNTS